MSPTGLTGMYQDEETRDIPYARDDGNIDTTYNPTSSFNSSTEVDKLVKLNTELVVEVSELVALMKERGLNANPRSIIGRIGLTPKQTMSALKWIVIGALVISGQTGNGVDKLVGSFFGMP